MKYKSKDSRVLRSLRQSYSRKTKLDKNGNSAHPLNTPLEFPNLKHVELERGGLIKVSYGKGTERVALGTIKPADLKSMIEFVAGEPMKPELAGGEAADMSRFSQMRTVQSLSEEDRNRIELLRASEGTFKPETESKPVENHVEKHGEQVKYVDAQVKPVEPVEKPDIVAKPKVENGSKIVPPKEGLVGRLQRVAPIDMLESQTSKPNISQICVRRRRTVIQVVDETYLLPFSQPTLDEIGRLKQGGDKEKKFLNMLLDLHCSRAQKPIDSTIVSQSDISDPAFEMIQQRTPCK
ncbi:MAG: hypothetical protein WC525_08950 [Candidatus Thermoplasmatota archaeon]